MNKMERVVEKYKNTLIKLLEVKKNALENTTPYSLFTI